MTVTDKNDVVVTTTLLVTILCPLLAFWAAAEPRGVLFPAFAFYPFAWLAMIPAVHHDWIGITVALMQFPVYGFILGRAWSVDRLYSRAVWLAAVHAAFVAIALWFYFFGGRSLFLS